MEKMLSRKTTLKTADVEGLLEILQETATAHAQLWHCGREEMLRDYHCGWMIVRTWVGLYEPLSPGELELRTWTCPPKRGVSRREFDLFSGGRRVGEAVQGWILADVTTRRIRNIAMVQPLVEAACSGEEKPVKLRRPALPEDLAVLGNVEVRAEDIDGNGHLNNAHYPRYALSVLPGRTLRQMLISYSRECFVGDIIQIQGKTQGDQAWLRGCVDGHDSFAIQAEFFPE